MQSAASSTSPSAARLAAMLARTLLAVPVSTLPLFAPLAVARQRFPSSPSPIVPFTAAIASLRCVRTANQTTHFDYNFINEEDTQLCVLFSAYLLCAIL